MASPLLETTISGASHVIINISGDITLMDASDAAEYVQELAGEEANIIFGAMYDETKSDEATVTVIATGLHNSTESTASRLKSKIGVTKPAGSVFATDTQAHTALKTDMGRVTQMPQQTRTTTAAPETNAPTAPSTPSYTAGTGRVKEQTIKIPDFFKK